MIGFLLTPSVSDGWVLPDEVAEEALEGCFTFHEAEEVTEVSQPPRVAEVARSSGSPRDMDWESFFHLIIQACLLLYSYLYY
jgi:hypothetical protein